MVQLCMIIESHTHPVLYHSLYNVPSSFMYREADIKVPNKAFSSAMMEYSRHSQRPGMRYAMVLSEAWYEL